MWLSPRQSAHVGARTTTHLKNSLLPRFHALNMGTVLVAMGGYGTALGWSIRNKPAEKFEPAPTFILPAGSNLGKTTSELHATLMSVMGLIFFLGANGGLVLSLVQVCSACGIVL